MIKTENERLVILDTETTGLRTSDDNRIIEIAAIEMIDRTVTDQKFHEFINPERPIEVDAERIHGISLGELLDKPLFSEIADEFLNFIKGSRLIIHNASFDVGFINHELKKLDPEKYHQIEHYSHISCTLEMARKRYPSGRNSLDALCQKFGVNNSNRTLHGALIDCDLLAQVYLALTSGQNILFKRNSKHNEDISESLTSFDSSVLLPIKVHSKERILHEQYMTSMGNPIIPSWEK